MDSESNTNGQWGPVGTFESLSEAREHALVILAMGRDCWIQPAPDDWGFQIMAESGYAQAIRREFAEYASERETAARSVETPRFATGLEIALLWVVSLFWIHYLQTQDPAFTQRFCNSSTGLFEHGEWWRPFTSLFLHADLSHLLGNVVFGLVFCLLVAFSVGPWTAWLLILGSGAAGNVFTAWFHHPGDFQSLGASTATFGALGILVGYGALIAWRTRSYRRLRGLIVPLGGGAFLLGWLGQGGPQTDVLGHIFGFLAGVMAGLAAAKRQSQDA